MGLMFRDCSSLNSVPLFDTRNVTNISEMFYHCTSLVSIPLFDTSNVSYMNSTLRGCTSLTYIPLFDTSNVIAMNYMCQECYNVEGGALSLYQQASTQTIPPSRYDWAFKDCGKNTPTGLAELQQIPRSWGGLG